MVDLAARQIGYFKVKEAALMTTDPNDDHDGWRLHHHIWVDDDSWQDELKDKYV